MTERKIKTFSVHPVKGYSSYTTRFETYEEAEAEARKNAWSEGVDYFVMAAIARVEAPEEINTVKVTKL